MYAVVQIGSAQFKVSEGDSVTADRAEGKIGQDIKLDKVLLFSDGKDIQVGTPYLDKVRITAKMVAQPLGEKLIAFKFRKRKDSSSRKGHRQKQMVLNITKIAG